WSDTAIEVTLVQALKSTGGLSHDRGVSDSLLTKWILTVPIVADVFQQLESFCGLLFTTSEQHSDARDGRILRDNQYVAKFEECFSSHGPFSLSDSIMSLSSGIVGHSAINCHR
ncbi:hypothetical protein ILUMI_16333, partial [Ignelater luminosus]